MIKSIVILLILVFGLSFSYSNSNEIFSKAYKKIEFQNIPALMLYRHIDSVTAVIKKSKISYLEPGYVISSYSKAKNSIKELRYEFDIDEYEFQFNKDGLIVRENKILRQNEILKKRYRYNYKTNRVICIVENQLAKNDTIIYSLKNNLIVEKQMNNGENNTIIHYKYNKKEQLIRIDKFSDSKPTITGEYQWKKNRLVRSVLKNIEGESIITLFDELQFPREEIYLKDIDTNYSFEYRY